jgi:hypothetical protein
MNPANGNLYAVWQDARFSNGQYTSVAFSMSTDGGFTWSAPIKINQTPDNVPAGDRQAFLPSVAVNEDGVVAVSYYDFRNNTPAPGLPTDLWMVHADGNFTNPASWKSENRMTPASFNMENAPLRAGYFIGDYEGLVAEGKNFGAFFSMPSATKTSGIFFRDPLPAGSGEDAFFALVDPPAAGLAVPQIGPLSASPSPATAEGTAALIGSAHAQDGVIEESLTAGTPRRPGVGGGDDAASLDQFFAVGQMTQAIDAEILSALTSLEKRR